MCFSLFNRKTKHNVAAGVNLGGYQPAQKWLKHRRGRKLSLDDIQHYKNIIAILDETDRIMKEIESI